MEAVLVAPMSLGETTFIWVRAVAMDVDVFPGGAVTLLDEG
jgi:hypothetical protein